MKAVVAMKSLITLVFLCGIHASSVEHQAVASVDSRRPLSSLPRPAWLARLPLQRAPQDGVLGTRSVITTEQVGKAVDAAIAGLGLAATLGMLGGVLEPRLGVKVATHSKVCCAKDVCTCSAHQTNHVMSRGEAEKTKSPQRPTILHRTSVMSASPHRGFRPLCAALRATDDGI